MSDIVSRLLLDTKQYDDSLGKAKQSSNDFASDVVGALSGAVSKFAGTIGVAVGGVEAFNKMMNSTQTTGDLMRGTMQSLKTSVDEFFFSINTGNLSGFISNLGEIAAKAREAYGAMDQLGNTQMSYGVFSAKNQAAIAEAQYLAKNKFAPTDVRTAAFGDWAGAIASEERNAQALQRELINAATKDVQSRIKANLEVTLEDLLRAFETDLLKPESRTEIKSRAEMGFRNYKVNEERTDWTQEQKDALAEVQRENIITYTLLEKYNDEQLQQIAQQIQQYYQLINAVKGLGREYNETANEFNNANKGVSGFIPVEALEGYTVYSGSSEVSKNFTQGVSKTVVEAAEGSLAALDQEIRKAQQEYANTASEAARQAAWETIQELQAAKAAIEFNARNPNGPKGSLSVGRSSLASLASVPDMGKIQPIPINKESVKNVNDYVGGINALSNVISALNTNTIDGAAGFLTWAANLATATAMAVDSAKALIPAKTAEGAASAGAEAAKTPFVGWMLVGGAIASALAAFASIPNFAEGGVVPGSNFRDGIAARVSSGEMVINPADQKKLFDSIHSGNLGGGGSTRSVITGEQIVTVVNNYGRRTGRGTILKG